MPSCKCVVFIGVLYLINADCASLSADPKDIPATTVSSPKLGTTTIQLSARKLDTTKPKPPASGTATGEQLPRSQIALDAIQDPQKRKEGLADAPSKGSQDKLPMQEEVHKEQDQGPAVAHNAETNNQLSSVNKNPPRGSDASSNVNQKIKSAVAEKNVEHPSQAGHEHPVDATRTMKQPAVSSTTTAPLHPANENVNKDGVYRNSPQSQSGSLDIKPSKQPSKIISKVETSVKPAEEGALASKAKPSKPHTSSIELVEQGPPKQGQGHTSATKGSSKQSNLQTSKEDVPSAHEVGPQRGDEHPLSSNIKNGAEGMKDSQELGVAAQDGLEFADPENITPPNPEGNDDRNLPPQVPLEPEGVSQVNPDEQDPVGFPEPNLPVQVPSQVDTGSVAHPQKPDAATADKFIGRFPSAEDDSHFFAYFLTAIVLCVMGYLAFHNKRKILALIVEGRHERLRRHTVYRRLDSADDDLNGRKGRGSF